MMKKKVLPALALAFLVLLGSEMTVFAAEDYCVVEGCSSCGRQHLQIGDIITFGDTIYTSGAGNRVWVENSRWGRFNMDSRDSVPYIIFYNTYYPEGSKWKYTKREVQGDAIYITYYYFEYYDASEVDPKTDPTPAPVSGQEADPVSGQKADPVPVSAGNAVSHEHYYEWVEAYEPSVSGDGLMQHKCSCGSVDDQYTVPAAVAYLQTFCMDIQNAPENAVVEWKPEMFRCYTRRMMEELAKRPDVTLITTYTEADGTTKSFTIPAGQALVDDELFYGFTYLGNLYGWN